MAAFAIAIQQYHQPMRQGIPVEFDKVPTWIDNLHFTASGNSAYAVPAGISMVIISCDTQSIWVCFTGTAAVPSANVTNGSGSLVIPSQQYRRFCDVAGGTISVAVAAACNVSIEGFA